MANEAPCGQRIWDGRYWCALPAGHDGAHESAPFGQQVPWSDPPDQPHHVRIDDLPDVRTPD